MASMNRVFLAGNLTKDPEMRKTQSGTPVADLGLAISDSYQDKNGERVETACFTDVVVWGELAKYCGQYLAKGSPILVEGRLELDNWETNQGEKRTRLRVRAQRVQFLGKPRNGNGTGNGAAATRPAPARNGSGDINARRPARTEATEAINF